MFCDDSSRVRRPRAHRDRRGADCPAQAARRRCDAVQACGRAHRLRRGSVAVRRAASASGQRAISGRHRDSRRLLGVAARDASRTPRRSPMPCATPASPPGTSSTAGSTTPAGDGPERSPTWGPLPIICEHLQRPTRSISPALFPSDTLQARTWPCGWPGDPGFPRRVCSTGRHRSR